MLFPGEGSAMVEEEKLVTRFYIEDGLHLFFESTLRTSLLPILPLSLLLTFISFILPGSEDEGIGYFTAFFLMIFLILYLFITLPTALYLWSGIKRRSHVDLKTGSLEVYMEGHMEEYIESRIDLENIRSVHLIKEERLKKLKRDSKLYMIGILPRPKRIPVGFYHALSRPDGLVAIELFHRVPVYMFHKHTLDLIHSWGGSDKGRLTDRYHRLVADTSGQSSRRIGSSRRRDTAYGPVIRRHITSEVLVKVKDPDKFVSILSGITKNNPVPPYDPTAMDQIRLNEEFEKMEF